MEKGYTRLYISLLLGPVIANIQLASNLIPHCNPFHLAFSTYVLICYEAFSRTPHHQLNKMGTSVWELGNIMPPPLERMLPW